MATMMKWSRCSKLGVLLAVTIGLTLAVPVAAVSTSASGVPDEAEVGTEVEATYTLTDLYEDGVNEWTLRGSTELDGVSWLVEKRKLSGDTTTESYGGSSFETTVSATNDVDRVTVSVVGSTPAVEAWQYDPPEQFTMTRLVRIKGENENSLGTWEVHHFTADSAAARTAIDRAQDAVDDDSPADAQRDLEQAVSAYEAGNFDNAISNAEDAEDAAREAQQARQRRQLLFFGGLGVLALLIVFGGVYYYQRQQQEYTELR